MDIFNNNFDLKKHSMNRLFCFMESDFKCIQLLLQFLSIMVKSFCINHWTNGRGLVLERGLYSFSKFFVLSLVCKQIALAPSKINRFCCLFGMLLLVYMYVPYAPQQKPRLLLFSCETFGNAFNQIFSRGASIKIFQGGLLFDN